jgi:CubicO group peptidase (beta-lactamase class C family)
MITEQIAAPVDGHCDARFAELAREFERNFAERGELGAAVAVRFGGELVVDLWGGWRDADRTQPWTHDTLTVVMSCTKGATALCAHMLAVAGELDFDAPVSRYWPEFAANGKQSVLVRHLLTHQAGVPCLRDPVPPGAMLDWDEMVTRLANERPFWEPGTAHGYHGLTYGWLVGELVRRISGQSIGHFFRREVGEPADVDFWIGLPASEHRRFAPALPAPPPGPDEPVSKYLTVAMSDPQSIQALMMMNTGGYLTPEGWNSPDALAAQLPAVGGVGTARGLATMYDAVGHHRRVGRVSFEPEDLMRMSSVQTAGDEDLMLFTPGRWALGFNKSTSTAKGVIPTASVVLSEDAFGHPGMGGSIGFTDPVADMSFAYVMNQHGSDLGLDARGQSLVDAVYRALGYRQPKHGRWVPAVPARVGPA